MWAELIPQNLGVATCEAEVGDGEHYESKLRMGLLKVAGA